MERLRSRSYSFDYKRDSSTLFFSIYSYVRRRNSSNSRSLSRVMVLRRSLSALFLLLFDFKNDLESKRKYIFTLRPRS
jgi:hypothetical protein